MVTRKCNDSRLPVKNVERHERPLVDLGSSIVMLRCSTSPGIRRT